MSAMISVLQGTTTVQVPLEELLTQLSEPENKVEPLSKEITQEIRTILEECRDGKRLHSQDAYATVTDCGTAHCIAGWKVYDDFGDKVIYFPFVFGDPNEFGIEIEDYPGFDAWAYAEKAWGLTDTEATTLFLADSTFEEQFSLLEELEAGNRFI